MISHSQFNAIIHVNSNSQKQLKSDNGDVKADVKAMAGSLPDAITSQRGFTLGGRQNCLVKLCSSGTNSNAVRVVILQPLHCAISVDFIKMTKKPTTLKYEVMPK